MRRAVSTLLCALAAAISLPTAASATQIVKTFTGPAQQIPDVQTTVTNISIPNFNVVPVGVTVSLNGFKHTFIGDLLVTLTHNGVSATLLKRQCGGTDATGGIVTFSDAGTTAVCNSAGGSYTLKPNTPLSVFTGTSAAGTWTMTIADQAQGDSGSTTGWTLGITYDDTGIATNWVAGSWSDWSTTCGSATHTRSVTCAGSDGNTYPDSYCGTAAKPPTSETNTVTTGCTYAWNSTAWTETPGCSTTGTDTRTVTCRQSDGTTVGDSQCTGTKPPTTQPDSNPTYGACTYSWSIGPWSDWSTTCGQATRSRVFTCLRSDGAVAPDAQCGDDPHYTGDWNYNDGRYETIYYQRTDSAHVTTSCTYAWQTGDWSVTRACGPTDQSRSVVCRESDGYTVDDAQCSNAGAKPPTHEAAAAGTTDYTTCSYSWSPNAWSALTPGCGPETQTRSLTCLRSDGVVVPSDSHCSSSPPATSQTVNDYETCSYAWYQTGYSLSQCTAANQQTYRAIYSCYRSTGQKVDSADCPSPVPSRVNTMSCDYWAQHADDPFPVANPDGIEPTAVYSRDGATSGSGEVSSGPEGTSGGTVGTTPPTPSHTGGTYDRATNSYIAPDGTLLTGGYYDPTTNTYWDSPELFQAAKPKFVLMRRKMPSRVVN